MIINADSILELKKFRDNSVDLILSDIPYGIGADHWDVLHNNTNVAYLGKSPAQQQAGSVFKRRGKPINGWSEADKNIPKEYYAWCQSWASEWLRVLKPGGSAIVFAGRRFAPRCIVALEDAGFNFRDMLSWIKPKASHRAQRLSIVYERRGLEDETLKWDGWRIGNLRPLFEPIIWCFKPYKHTIADNVLQHNLGAYNQQTFEQHMGHCNNILEIGMSSKEGGFHDAQKPVKLLETLITLVTIPGQVVLDPFAGSGSTAIAAHNLGRKYIMIEKDKDIYSTMMKRINQHEDSKGLFD
ncbi:TPA: site-specific DNA-methyltransferase [Klebsiella aerogenes]|uniref:DNA-methyltransferase n=1 Tax=Klebsiella quasipneumoniae TaxID=1463165 RepID=UPI001034A41C|nr:site-specific DNA-methyltransferase [Klebsiella quasipneumoniae]MDG0653669.1 site-specific DNA-methyltransferase [Klebsiella quasipneumoniae]HBR1699827.1 site-specific DNA-methyltransferase [Klebsiella pneumoniae]HCM2993362.1 site-specific DNA-methyltransferase [Klebsiella aerogenes]